MTHSHEHSPQGRVVALLSALALSLIGVAGVATPAVAADYGNVDTTKDGSIIIHKHVQAGSTQSGTPDGFSSTITSDPVPGVIFTSSKLTDLDLTTALGWAGVPTSVPATACDTPSLSGHTLAAGVASPVTDSTGKTTISLTHPNAVGAYLVCETTSPSNVVDKAQPFVVTIPYSYNEGWLYNVNVYPKNGLASIAKTVATPVGLGLGSTASFPVTTDVPKIAANANFQYYWVQDAMDTRLTGATVASVKVLSTGADVLSSYYTVATSGTNVVSVQFNTAGLTWLSTFGQAKIVTTFTGVVATLGNGIISDTAYLGTKAAVASVPVTPATPPANPSASGLVVSSGQVTQNWGDLAVHKVDAGELTTGVQGAVFEVLAAAAPYAATCDSTDTEGDAILVNGETTFTSDVSGLLSIPGLFVSDNKNDTVDADHRCYVLREVAAPAGFILPTTGSELTAVTVKTGATNTAVGYDAEITNTRIQGVVLPMTGSNGIVVLSVAGLALIAAGLVLAFLARRRRQTA